VVRAPGCLCLRRNHVFAPAAHAGPIALAAGLAFAAEDTWRLLAANRSLERIEMMRQTPFQLANAFYFVVFIGLMLALVSVYMTMAALGWWITRSARVPAEKRQEARS
jgi:hypothetical protein